MMLSDLLARAAQATRAIQNRFRIHWIRPHRQKLRNGKWSI